MGVLTFLDGIFQPAAHRLDSLDLGNGKRTEIEKELARVQREVSTRVLEYEAELAESRAAAAKWKTTNHSWLQRNWRPITMLTFLGLVVLDAFGLIYQHGDEKGLPEGAWILLQIGLGGYVIGRSAEKGVSMWKSRETEAKG
jgi:hypothetical protein